MNRGITIPVNERRPTFLTPMERETHRREQEDQSLRAALVDAVAFIDLVLKGADHGWTAADVKKLEAIRALAVMG